MGKRRRQKYSLGSREAELLRLLYGPPEADYAPLCDPNRLGYCPGCGAESGEAACAICAGRSEPAGETGLGLD